MPLPSDIEVSDGWNIRLSAGVTSARCDTKIDERQTEHRELAVAARGMRIFIDTLPIDLVSMPAMTLTATWFGIGLIEPFQGFLAALTVLPLLCYTSARGRGLGLAFFFVPTAVIAFIVAGVWFARTGIIDDGRIVIDEVAGVCLAAIGGWKSRRWTLAVPPLFSSIDRLKLWPLSELESVRPADFGVLLDDCGAGLAAAMTMLLLRALLRWRVRRRRGW